MNKIFILFILIFILNNCSEEINYSGKILEQENFENINYKNKQTLLENLGNPSFVDPVTKKFFYFSKKERKKSIFKQNTDYSFIFVFEFNEKDEILTSKVYDLKNMNNFEMIKDETDNEIVKRGLLEKIFGGVGPQQEISTSP